MFTDLVNEWNGLPLWKKAVIGMGGVIVVGLVAIMALTTWNLYGSEQTVQEPTITQIAQAVTAAPVLEATPTMTLPTATPTSGSAKGDDTKEAGFRDSVVVVTTADEWEITWYDGADLDRGDGTTFREDAEDWTWRVIAPDLWPVYPNEPNPLVPEFRVEACKDAPTKLCVPDGVEIAMAETNFCQQLAGEECHVPVAARHYNSFSGDYDIPEIGACEEAETGIGCELIIVNVGDVTADITGVFGQGFRMQARYWNGNALDMAMWGLSSSIANFMMHLTSELNPMGSNNGGANCSVPTGCEGVHVRIVFISGNEQLMQLTTTVYR